ncbi:MAG TPA: discoidin domain-containing protein [Pyrinomonadaceae bacterium]|nr:discoidin domain-containing protein [Pyrinomonadaceae bacterium]
MKQRLSTCSRLFVPLTVLFLAVTPIVAQTPSRSRSTSLDGYWQFEMDPTDAGIRQEWFKRDLRRPIRLPGILQSQKYGFPISTTTPWVLTLYDHFWYLREDYKAYTEPGKVKVPFLSQPPRHYLGAAWYQRDFQIPRSLSGRRLVLTLERPHWLTTVWIDDRMVGSQSSLVAPHVYDLGAVAPGYHRLTVRVDNRLILPYRPDAHSVSDSLGGSWNGIVGAIELSDTGRVWIDDAQVFPNLAQHTMLIKVRIGNATGRSGSATLTAIWPDVGVVPVTWDENGGTAEVQVPIRLDAETWDEFHPKRYPLRLWLKGTDVDEYEDLSVGLRDFHAEGNQFILNGRPIIFRGTHSGGDFPLTGYPPTDVKSWLTLFETCKKWGLNHMRFHSWCPPEAAFEAADQIGFYLQPEPGMWNEISPGTPMERMLYEETDRMIKAYGNHPSFMLLSASNEPKGRWQESLSKWVSHYHAEDARRLYASGTGHTERELEHITDGTDYLAMQRINQLMLRRESGWFGGDFGQSLVDINIPVISHEVGQWVAYPDYDIIKKFKDGYLQPGNYEIFRDSMEAHGLLEKDKRFAQASGRYQLECYKEEIEANLRTPGLGGFQLLDLHDYLGQGTALVGLLDAFWESKGYVEADEFREFCNTTVPLARMPRRVYTTADAFSVDVELAHFGAEPMKDGKAVWVVGNPDDPTARGEWPTRDFPIGKNIPLGRVSLDLSTFGAPGEYTLRVTVAPETQFDVNTRKIRPGAVRGVDYFENEWKFWVYPISVPDQLQGSPLCPLSRVKTDILVTRLWDEAEKTLAAGGKVLFVPRNTDLDWTSPPLDTVPVFWNRQMGPAWGRMLGLLIGGGGLGNFPSDSHFDWQWASLLGNVRAINLDRLPKELAPAVWAIDDWNRNYKLGVVFECAVGDGKLLVSAIDVTKPNDSNPVARQLRYSLMNYMASDCFQPRIPVSPAQMRTLFFDTRIMKKLGATAQVSGEPATQLLDGDPNTFFLAGDRNAAIREPLEVTVTFPAPVAISGLVLMPRQNHREHEGDIREYSVQVSDNGSEWREVQRGELGSTFAPQQISFSRTVTTRYLKLVSLSGFGTDKMTALAELAVMYAGPRLDDQGNPSIEYERNRTATPEIDEGVDKRAKPSPTPRRP